MNTRIATAACSTISALAVVGAAHATTVVIPDSGGFQYFGSGDASVTYDGVTFVQQASLGNGNFFNIGTSYSGAPAPDISSQEQTVGVANILIELPTATTSLSLPYGTFNGSAVTFLLSNGGSFTQPSTGGSNYAVLDMFSVSSTPFNTVLITSPDYVLDISNVTYGAVPEPGAWVMMLLGIGLGGAALRGARGRRTQPIRHSPA